LRTEPLSLRRVVCERGRYRLATGRLADDVVAALLALDGEELTA
jgi:hypothetical protein